MAYRRERPLLNGSSQKRNMRSSSPSSSHGDHEEPALRERAPLNGSSQKRNMRSSSPSSSHGDHEEPALHQQQQHAHQLTTYSFALVNWGGGSSTEDAGGYVSLVKEVVQGCERVVKVVVQSCEGIVIDARTDVLLTLRYLVKFASMVAITAIVGYCFLQVVPHRV